MNIQALHNLSKDHPAIARTLEVAATSFVLYILGSLIEGDIFSWRSALIAFITPVYIGLSKYERDVAKTDNK